MQDGPPTTEHERGYLVFSQQGITADIDGWNGQGSRFFDLRVGFERAPEQEGAAIRVSVVATPSAGSPGVVVLRGRARSALDLALAETAETRARGGGLARLAHRCPSVWLVERRQDEDPLALRLAAVIASVVLGPILDARSSEIFGVKTARAKLAPSTA